MNERLDPEEVAGIMGRVKAEAVRIIEEYGGIVNQFVGDEVLALFGIPTAHGDDPRRAVQAALELHKVAHRISPEVEGRIGHPLRMHTGVNTGLIVTNLRDARDGTFGITGDTVNTGARLKALAGDDEILVSPETQRLIAPFFDTAPLPATALKGKGHAVAPYRVAGEARGAAKGRQPFVGRRSELRQFAGIVEACVETGRGEAVFVRGEAGIGKTRLVEEFQAAAEERGFVCHRGLTLDFGIGKGRDAIRAVVRSLLGIAPGSGKDMRREAAERALAAGLVTEERAPFLHDLLDYRQPRELRALYDAMDNDTRRRGRRAAVLELVRAASAQAPLLVVIEDVHWAAEPALTLLAALTTEVGEIPALLVMTSRIEGDPLDAAWRSAAGGSPLLTMDLAPLRKEEARDLAGKFMDATSRFAVNCVERAEGNPLFLEQLLRGAEETADQDVPGSVQSIVLARMDRLSPPDKLALQSASVLGQRFGLEDLRHLIQDPAYDCAGLIAHYLVRPEGEEFLFCHALIQEGVYSSLLKARRREQHRRAAEWFAGRDLVLRAEHLARAEHPAAPQAYLEAATNQAEEFRFERALELTRRGLELATALPEQHALTCLHGQLLHDLGDLPGSIATYEAALDVAGSDAERCRTWIGVAAGMRMLDRYEEALQALDKAEAAAGDGLVEERALLHQLRGNIYFPLGNLDGCLEQHELSLTYGRKGGLVEYEARALGGLGDAHYLCGRMRTAHDHFQRCVALCRQEGLGRVEVAHLHMCGWTGMYLNEIGQALQAGRATVALATQVNQRRATMLGHGLVGYMLMNFLGANEEARTHLEQATAMAKELGARRFEAWHISLLGQAVAGLGNTAEAVRLLEEGVEIGRETGMTFAGPNLLGALACHTEDAAARQAALAEGKALLEEGCVGHAYFMFNRQAIEVSLQQGEWDEAERYAAALEDYTRPEPLPWSDFFIARGRALAAHGRGEHSAVLTQRLAALRDEAVAADLKTAVPALDAALAGK